MTISTIDESQSKAARVVGFTYLFAMVTAVFGNYFRGSLIVSANAVETAQNIIAHEYLFRLVLASELLVYVIDIVLITALYVILNPVNRHFVLLAVFLRLMETATLVVSTLSSFVVLKLLSGAEYLQVFEVDRLQALAKLSLSEFGAGYKIGFVFLGLGSTVFSYLWLKSNYIPRALAVLGVFSSLLLAICNFAFIVFPNLERIVTMAYMAPMGVFEIAMGFWLLFKRLRQAGVAESIT
ncbi:DUF4386 domain-containing protein [bacterium]|nr:DUF4386 domain-containing protein [bacterium]